MVSVDEFYRNTIKPVTSEIPVPIYQDGDHIDRLSITQRVHEHPEAHRVKLLASSSSTYEALKQSIYDALFITDLDGYIHEVNVRAEYIFQRNELQLKELNIIDLISGADQELMKVIRRNVTDEKYTVIEAVCLRADNTRFYAEIVVNRINISGQPQLCFFVRDITRKKQAEDELREANEKLLEAEKTKARLQAISDLLYELNNPLQILLSIAYLDNNKEYMRQLERITEIISKFRSENIEGGKTEESLSLQQSTRIPETPKTLQPCDAERLLIVDDEEMIRQMLSETLSHVFPDKSIDVAQDGQVAVNLFQTKRHAVIILDVVMPVLNGEDAFTQIESLCKRYDWEMPHVIFCAGFGIGEKVRTFVGDGSYHALLRKPFVIDELVKLIRERLPQPQSSPSVPKNT
jgi:PAS domain S-box-containing protein